MCCVRFTISASCRKVMEDHLKTAQRLGRLRQVKYLLAILAVLDGQSLAQVALVLRVHEKTVATWFHAFCCYGLQDPPRTKPPGRPPKLTPTQQATLATLIEEGPVKAGFSGACWRSPMIQQLIYERFGVYYNVFYIAQLLKNLGFSYHLNSVFKFFQVDITGIVRMTSCARYFKEGVGSSRPNWRWIMCFLERPKANTSCNACVKLLSFA